MSSQPPQELFYSYSHKDERLRNKLDNHLSLLQRQGIISEWHDRMIEAGDDWESEINTHLDSAKIILLLVSDDFIASDYCYSIEMERALERHRNEEALVIPIILRPVDWESSPLSKLQALPKDGKPVTNWKNRDDAFKNIAQGIRRKIKNFKPKQSQTLILVYIPRPPIIGFVARRDAEGRNIVERLKEELAPGKNQLVTLSGPGGVGKTTLAAEAARTLEKTYQGRFVWSDVNVRSSFTLSTLLDDIATQLGQPHLRQLRPEDKEARVRAIVADPPALVVLDNYETIPLEDRPTIETWFEHTNCSALITSRQRIDKSLNIVISAMSPDEAEEFLKRLVEQTSDAQIFSDDIRRRIYETAEKNPFVMEWIVAQIDAAQEPDTVLEELKHGEGDAAERVFDRSFNLPQLGDDGRDTLLALSLFTPSATRDALAVVAGFSDDPKRVNEAVKNLHALWLIKGLDLNSRFTIEGLTRTLAAAHLSKDDRAAEFKERFIKYFRIYTEEHERPVPENYDLMEAEKYNLLKAMDMSFDLGDLESGMEMASILAAPVSGMLSVRGYWDYAIQCGEQALQAAYNANMDNNIAFFAHSIAGMYQLRGGLAKARQLYDESLEIYKRLGDQRAIALTLWGIGNIALEQANSSEAKMLFEEALKTFRRLQEQKNIAGVLHQLGRLAQDQGELEEAGRLYNESLEIEKKLGNQRGIAYTLYNLALIAKEQGDLAEAGRLWREALSIYERLGLHDAEDARRNLERIKGES